MAESNSHQFPGQPRPSPSRAVPLRSVLHLLSLASPHPTGPSRKPTQDPGSDDSESWGWAFGDALHLGGREQGRAEDMLQKQRGLVASLGAWYERRGIQGEEHL